MALDTASVALISAAVGASGAVLAQIVSSAFSARRDSSRLSWEQQRASADDLNRRAEALVDIKRLVFVRLLTMARTRFDLIAEIHYMTGSEKDQVLQKFDSSKHEWWERWEETIAEATLLEPGLEEAIQEVGARFAQWNYELWDEPHAALTMDIEPGVPHLLGLLRDRMRVSLGTRELSAPSTPSNP